MHRPKNLQNILIGTTALFCVGGAFVPHQSSGPVLSSAVALVSAKPASGIAATAASAAASAANVVASARKSMSPLSEEASVALSTLSSMVQPLSSPKALEDAFHSYFAF